MPHLDPLSEINDDVAKYFRKLGYTVTWDYGKGEQWYEILKGDELVCQFDFGVPLVDLYMDLPLFLCGKNGISKSDYTLNCARRELLAELYEKMGSIPLVGSVQQ